MVMVRRGDNHGVDLLHLFEHPAIITEKLRAGVNLAPLFERMAIHVAERDDVRAGLGNLIGVTRPLSAGANGGDVKFAVQVLSPHKVGTG